MICVVVAATGNYVSIYSAGNVRLSVPDNTTLPVQVIGELDVFGDLLRVGTPVSLSTGAPALPLVELVQSGGTAAAPSPFNINMNLGVSTTLLSLPYSSSAVFLNSLLVSGGSVLLKDASHPALAMTSSALASDVLALNPSNSFSGGVVIGANGVYSGSCVSLCMFLSNRLCLVVQAYLGQGSGSAGANPFRMVVGSGVYSSAAGTLRSMGSVRATIGTPSGAGSTYDFGFAFDTLADTGLFADCFVVFVCLYV